MENWHIRLDYEKAIESKKELLSSEIDLLNLISSGRNYFILRKSELETKNKIKANISVLKAKLKLLMSTLPQGSVPKIENKIKMMEAKLEEEHKDDLEIELEEIKARLRKLG